jgi:hypothetical protein
MLRPLGELEYSRRRLSSTVGCLPGPPVGVLEAVKGLRATAEVRPVGCSSPGQPTRQHPGAPEVPAVLRGCWLFRSALPVSSCCRPTARAISLLQAGSRDIVFCQEQLLLAMRLVIEHGQPGATWRDRQAGRGAARARRV